MTALIGAMLGLAINHISERPSRRPIALIVGSGLGFVIGAAYQAIEQEKTKMLENEPREQNKELGQQNNEF